LKIPEGIKIYGDIHFRDDKCRKERVEQKEFFAWLKENRPALHKIALHPKNEGKRTNQQAQDDRELGGLTKGASDILIPAGVTFVCEIKRVDHTKSKITKPQVSYLLDTQALGAFSCIALGSEAAIQAVLDWESKYFNK
jgi:hypothetical protein